MDNVFEIVANYGTPRGSNVTPWYVKPQNAVVVRDEQVISRHTPLKAGDIIVQMYVGRMQLGGQCAYSDPQFYQSTYVGPDWQCDTVELTREEADAFYTRYAITNPVKAHDGDKW